LRPKNGHPFFFKKAIWFADKPMVDASSLGKYSRSGSEIICLAEFLF